MSKDLTYMYNINVIKQNIFEKYQAPGGNKIWKSYFYLEGQSQGPKTIELGVIWKGVIRGVCMPNIKSLSFMTQNLKRRLKLAIDRQDKTNMPPITQSRGIKSYKIQKFLWTLVNCWSYAFI